MLQFVLNSLFGCTHQRTTFPMTPGRKAGGFQSSGLTRTYVACLDCGREMEYDWKSMRLGKPVNGFAPAAGAHAVPSRP